MSMDENFSRSELLMGDEGMEKLRAARVILFGVGGVGSWCAEALIRTGIANLTIVDFDRVSPSNINRQLMATTETIGEVKVDAMKRRLLSINPSANITAVNTCYSPENAHDFNFNDYDVVIDCIDSLRDKALLIEKATDSSAKLFSSMGAALKMDPRKIEVAEFWKVKGCPLARALRQRFKKQGIKPRKKFLCVYSEELLSNKGQVSNSDLDAMDKSPIKKGGPNGSLMHITGIFGMTLAGLAIQYLLDHVS